MIWALLAILGIPIWLVVGALLGATWSRRRFLKRPDVFAVKARVAGAEKWPRRGGYARVVHDVLITSRGVALLRASVEGMTTIDDVTARVAPSGMDAVFAVTFDDGRIVELAVDEHGAERLHDAARRHPAAS